MASGRGRGEESGGRTRRFLASETKIDLFGSILLVPMGELTLRNWRCCMELGNTEFLNTQNTNQHRVKESEFLSYFSLVLTIEHSGGLLESGAGSGLNPPLLVAARSRAKSTTRRRCHDAIGGGGAFFSAAMGW